MESLFYKGSKRGFANHGWLKASHTFSFGNYYDSEKMNFGKLRVLNDDRIAAGHGFDLHPHQDMEIITIPLSGVLRHADNMGNEGTISVGEVQVMSAGSGVWHSEFNDSETEELKLFQIWIISDKKGHKPRFEQKRFDENGRLDKWHLLVSPKGKNDALGIHQNAFISIIDANNIESINYRPNEINNGVYFMVIEGRAEINGQPLEKRDAIGLWNLFEPLEIQFQKGSKLLAIEVPMQ